MPNNPEYVVVSAEAGGSTICTLCKPTSLCEVCQRREEVINLVSLTDSVEFRMKPRSEIFDSTVAIVSLQPPIGTYSRIEYDEYIVNQIKTATRVYCIPAMDINWSGVACSRVRTNLKRLLSKRNRQLPAGRRLKLDSIKKKDAINILKQVHTSWFLKYFSENSRVMPRHAKVYFHDISKKKKFYQNVNLSEIPGTSVTAKQIEKLHTCVICLEGFTKGDIVNVLGCRHFYHPDCIYKWSFENNTCPYCRKFMDVRSVVNFDKVQFTPVENEIAAKVVDAACYASIMLSFRSTALVSRVISPAHNQMRRDWFASRSHIIVKIATTLRMLEEINEIMCGTSTATSVDEAQEQAATIAADDARSLMELLSENSYVWSEDAESNESGVYSLVFYNA